MSPSLRPSSSRRRPLLRVPWAALVLVLSGSAALAALDINFDIATGPLAERAVDRDPRNGASVALAGRHPRTDERDGDELWADAYEHHQEPTWLEAAELFEAAAEAGHRPATAYYNAACGYSRARSLDRAAAALERAIDEGFDDVRLADRDDDLAHLRRDPRWRELRSRIAGNDDEGDDEDRREREQALRAYQRLAASGTARADRWNQVAMELHRLGEYTKAASAWQNAVALDPDGAATPTYNRACALARLGQDDEAFDQLERAIERGFDASGYLADDDDLDSLRDLPRFAALQQAAERLDLPGDGWKPGTLHRRTAIWQATLADAEAHLREHPKSGRARFNIGFAHLRLDQPKAAAADFIAAYELTFRPGASAYNAACGFALAGDADNAFAWLDKAQAAGFDVGSRAWHDDDLERLHDDRRLEKYPKRHGRGHIRIPLFDDDLDIDLDLDDLDVEIDV